MTLNESQTNTPAPSKNDQASELMRVIEMYGYGLTDIRAFVASKSWGIRFIGDLNSDQMEEITKHFRERAGW